MSIPSHELVSPAPGNVLGAVAQEINRRLDSVLEEKRSNLLSIDDHLEPVGETISSMIDAGGKRLRPAFLWWGYMAACDNEPTGEIEEVLYSGCAVELLHTFALIHDDIMDRSDTRRGTPAAHKHLEALHEKESFIGDRGWFGISSAIVIGDLLAIWANQIFEQKGGGQSRFSTNSRRVFNILSEEVMAGQWLDIRLASLSKTSVTESSKVALLKSGRYSVARPLQLGATLAGVDDGVIVDALSSFGDALGVAFQFRDDVLGVFGDSDKTGKSAGSDIREGKRTVLMLKTLENASDRQREFLLKTLGYHGASENQLDDVRQIVVDTGAKSQVEDEISKLFDDALSSLSPIKGKSHEALVELADLVVKRKH